MPDYQGKFFKEADPHITRALKESGRLYKSGRYTHTYPFCWRCDSPLIYMARPSWYVRTTRVRERLLAHNRAIAWQPPEIGTGRFDEWLEGNVDWALSRDRFWGTPLPLWICGACGHTEAVESIAQLRERGRNVPAELDWATTQRKAKLVGRVGYHEDETYAVGQYWSDLRFARNYGLERPYSGGVGSLPGREPRDHRYPGVAVLPQPAEKS